MGWPDGRGPVESGRGERSALTTAEQAGAWPCPDDGWLGHGLFGRPDGTIKK